MHSSDALEQEFRKRTIGLVSADDFRKAREVRKKSELLRCVHIFVYIDEHRPIVYNEAMTISHLISFHMISYNISSIEFILAGRCCQGIKRETR